MEKKKIKTGLASLLVVGVIFTFVGVIYAGIAVSTFFWNAGSNTVFFRCIFGGIGIMFLAIGILCLWLHFRNRSRLNQVISSGKYIMADITGSNCCYNVRIMGRHPYVITCQYQDISGNLHIFRSRYLQYDPEPYLKDRTVRVYVDEENYKYYYVDIDQVLPNVIAH